MTKLLRLLVLSGCAVITASLMGCAATSVPVAIDSVRSATITLQPTGGIPVAVSRTGVGSAAFGLIGALVEQSANKDDRAIHKEKLQAALGDGLFDVANQTLKTILPKTMEPKLITDAPRVSPILAYGPIWNAPTRTPKTTSDTSGGMTLEYGFVMISSYKTMLTHLASVSFGVALIDDKSGKVLGKARDYGTMSIPVDYDDPDYAVKVKQVFDALTVRTVEDTIKKLFFPNNR